MNDLQSSFDLLRLKPGATPEEVKRAFREQVAAWHPDRFSADPAMQRRAEERLRLVIEAHRSIVACHGAHATGARGTGPARPENDRRDSPLTAGTFFRSVPNLVFGVSVLGCALLAGVRHGMTIHAWCYGLEMALVPTLFSLAYNLVARNSTAVRNLYLGFSLCALAVVVVDGATTGVEQFSPAGDREVFSPGGHDGGAVGSGWTLSPGSEMDRTGDGFGPQPPALRAPSVPLAPVAPAAPQAPAAPVTPLAR